ncbi:hypothetical protein GRI34_04525 [Erythrobacter aquimaris]|uniref:Putative Flp pilus-assembly TadG-like N-terminal domain-containing protein n=1 Tax=Qipengyuania aquimaris TaxID=255984 RepID=A0A6I4TID9_9SPHN|nr:pilus assembly protein TadG-related protein [Qipengyuania aquimaris]MXO95685.1 hypothetical protein [Qipengyuania aquimaris]
MLRKAVQFLKQVRDDARGNVLVLVAASLVPMVGTMGLAVDAAQWISWRRDLHSAADAGAMAGALAMKNGEDVQTVVTKVLGENYQHIYTIDAIETPPTAGDFAGDPSMVRVVLSTSRELPFSSLFLANAPTISVEAVAESSNEVPNCMIALDQASVGLTISGSASVNMNCGMASNSNFDATASGTGTIKAGALSAVGTVTNSGGVTADTAINNGTAPATDPFESVDTQPNITCSAWPLPFKGPGNTLGLNYGTYGCYQGIQIQNNATVTLAPGTYYIGAKGLSVGGGATLIGNNVTLVFTNTDNPFNQSAIGTISIAGTSSIQLTAPDTGPYAGLIIVQDSRIVAGNKNRLFLTGDSKSKFDGGIYAPTNHVEFSGNSSMTTDCLQIVSKFITFTGNTNVTNNCPAGRGVASFNGGEFLRLRQ